MKNKTIIIFLVTILLCAVFSQISIADVQPGKVQEGEITITYRNATVYAPAVAKTSGGYKGVLSTITVNIQNHGSGRVFVDTMPLAQIDMQGSARLAVKVASSLIEDDENCSVDPDSYDYFFVVRTEAPIIGGPSAGGIMAVTTLALLMNKTMNESTVMTGMINPDGTIGPVGGITKKIDAAATRGAKRFLIPKGQGTYTETMTEKNNKNGAIIIETETATKNVADYAMNEYGMEVVEVSTLRDVAYYFTGIEYTLNYSDKKINMTDYKNSLEPIAEKLYTKAKNQSRSAYNVFNETKSNIPTRVYINFYNYVNYQQEIENLIDDSIEEKNKANVCYEKESYYTSTSYSYRSLMSSRVVLYFCNYFNTSENNRESYVQSLIDDVSSFYDNQSEIARNASINSLISLQAIGAAQKRASMAASYLSDAEDYFDDDEYLNALKYLAWAKERADNIDWWIEMSNSFDKNVNITDEEIKEVALEYIGEAQQAVTYSEVLISEIGTSSDYLTGSSGAKSLLETAIDDKDRGYPAAALLESLEALVKANLAIETIGLDQNSDYIEKINIANNTTMFNIIKSEQQGVEPILPICYYEYAESLLNEEDYKNSLFYYKLSGMIAGALDFKNITTGSLGSRYVGVPKIKTVNIEEETNNLMDSKIFVILSIGIILGIALALLAIELRKTEDEKKQKEKWVPRSIREYEKNIGKNRIQDEIPKSIEDYYKKNK
jgi:uncharacterized protein